MRHFVHIAYKGTRYCGWQWQPGKSTVQEVLENSLSRIFKRPVPVFGCGRTDSGVHASQFFFHMDIVDSWDFDLVLRLNHMLPRDIAIYDILPVEGRLHARYDAVLRTYDYFIHTRKDPFLSESSALYLRDKLNVSEMGKAVALLPKYQDYGAYCKSPGKNEHNICRVSSATLFVDDSGTRIRFSISSNRFLGRMIRILAHKLIEISDGTFSVAEFESHLISRQPPSLIPPAHAEGLYLSKVSYPSLDLPTREDFQPNRDRQGDFWKEI